MSKSTNRIPVALEVGEKRVVASAVDWPGWTRVGRDESSALGALLAYAPRYKLAIKSARQRFPSPTDASAFDVVERLKGDVTTDFGAPGIPPFADAMPVDDAELKRLQAILKACWATFESTAASVSGKPLRKGPRGGGRTLDALVDHVIESHYSYLNRLNWSEKRDTSTSFHRTIEAIKKTDTDALSNAAKGNLPATGPRGGKLWQPRYFVRRAAWHILDHVWEIEDKVEA